MTEQTRTTAPIENSIILSSNARVKELYAQAEKDGDRDLDCNEYEEIRTLTETILHEGAGGHLSPLEAVAVYRTAIEELEIMTACVPDEAPLNSVDRFALADIHLALEHAGMCLCVAAELLEHFAENGVALEF